MGNVNSDLIMPQESYAIMGACFDVYTEKGCGFLEAVYQECLETELQLRGIPFTAQHELRLFYKGKPLKTKYKADLLCHEKIIVEIKAVEQLVPEHEAQLLNYLHASGLRLGILVNFGHHPKLEWKRLAL